MKNKGVDIMIDEIAIDNIYVVLDIIKVYAKKENRNPNHLHLTLYFCFAYYAWKFGNKDGYPKYLFGQGHFVATDFGPKFIIDQGKYYWITDYVEAADYNYFKIPSEIIGLINEISEMCNEKNFFELADRSHMDDCWKNHFRKEDNTIPFEEIWEEYIN